MIDFEVGHRSAELTTPAVSPKHSSTQFAIFAGIEPERHVFRQI